MMKLLVYFKLLLLILPMTNYIYIEESSSCLHALRDSISGGG
jgi:hypothetical protein